MKTALQEAIEKFEHALSYNVEGGICEPYSWTEFSNDFYKLLEKEKQQIIDAVNTCDNVLIKNEIGIEANANSLTLGEQYYNETYAGETNI